MFVVNAHITIDANGRADFLEIMATFVAATRREAGNSPRLGFDMWWEPRTSSPTTASRLRTKRSAAYSRSSRTVCDLTADGSAPERTRAPSYGCRDRVRHSVRRMRAGCTRADPSGLSSCRRLAAAAAPVHTDRRVVTGTTYAWAVARR